jgi:putative transposon-encoded protein
MENKDDLIMSLIKDTIEDIKNCREVSEKEVKKFGNSGHVIVSPEHIGKNCKIIIHNRKKERTFNVKIHELKEKEEDNKS